MTTEQFVEKYHVTKRTVQRDMASLRDLLAESNLDYQFVHQSRSNVYALLATNQLQAEQVLSLLKVLMGTRAFSQAELLTLRRALLGLLAPAERTAVKKLSSVGLAQYKPVGQGSQELLPSIKQFSIWIMQKTTLSFDYVHSSDGQAHTEVGVPISLYFADFYFYIVMFNENRPHAIYRLDRFQTIKPVTNKRIRLRYDQKINEAAFNNQTYLLHGGNELTFTFRYWAFPQTALDRLPQSRVIKTMPDHSVIIEAQSFEQGILLWLVGQGPRVKVLTPQSLVTSVQKVLKATLEKYND
ncbi:WYL domain-containing protein [Lactiplantibacillus sp. WILCCON 0030]|uniref:WYL domain-containing protein n=1 Tax=Lactiplantibacillus brownii TaxID=3069269 RepID=A0ABU1AA51_9LACO|nr:WYL domain-containing protein [Lactiplantibacillus brownii]MDQ7937753.1 WYL domain-containing protein [Lactiplantibacillus brownii]